MVAAHIYSGFFLTFNMKSKVIIYLLFFVGGISFFAGLYGLYWLYGQSDKMEHTVGVVTHLKTEKTYRHRKIVYKHTARIQYETKLYTTHVRMQLHNPFISQGSKISLWYDPDCTEEVVIPSEDGIVWGSIGGFGALCLFLGTVIVKTKKYED